MPKRLLSIDVGDTLATGPSLTAALRDAADLPGDIVAKTVRTRLHCAPEITDQVIGTVASDLELDISTVRDIVDNQGDLRVNPSAQFALMAIRDAFPDIRIVLNSNATAAATHQTMTVKRAFAGIIDDYYISCETGFAKGVHYQAFTHIADDHQVYLDEIIHIGDQLEDDVEAALKQGCAAMLVHPDHADLVEYAPAGPDRYRAAATIIDAAQTLRTWISEDHDTNPRLTVRGAMLIRDLDDRILIATGPSDHGKYYLPSGRCHPFFPQDPAATAVREIHEELGITLNLSKHDLLNTAWSHKETRRDGSNKIIFTFDAGHIDPEELTINPDHTEIADYKWATPEEAADALDPRELERLNDIEQGEHITFQHGIGVSSTPQRAAA
ncbi:NUDIX domain-containing protein [Saccharopolyspora sp. ASAGF58]|uniref:NUDIX domain-containing protein n=1 Tax=Saccharopolyspora sp. ASAGF58 TaxID=2719023 RepID=UPI00143FC04B|nr:NUDIX domain-containing protein [Saccharopolyspora sp. ASAGF58]QIZ37922.1 NUDIX domain-containing protein [Saccharopolyspora sp. ASAGF58]